VKLNLKYHQDHGVEWCETHLDEGRRWTKQREIIESVRDHRNTLVKSCHGIGKTYSAKDVAMHFLYTHPGSIVITTAPSHVQVEKLLWGEINRAYKNKQCPSLDGACLMIELKIEAGWYAIGLSPRIDIDDMANRFTGFHAHKGHMLIIFDEAPAVNPKLWEIKEALMTGEYVRFLGIGNPVQESGHFFEGFKDPLVSKISMNIFDSPNFIKNDITKIEKLENIANEMKQITNSRDYEKYWKKFKNPYPALTTIRWAVERLIRWGKNSPLFQSRVLGQFPKTTTDTIISLADLEDCKDLKIDKKETRSLGVDVARFGSDFTCFIGYENYNAVYKEKWNGQDTVKTANRIKYLIRTTKYNIVVIDDTGVGGGVTDMMYDFQKEHPGLTFQILPVNFAEKSDSDIYDGIVTDMWYNAKELVEGKQISVKDEGRLFAELTGRKYKFTTQGKIKVESKDDYKKRTGLASPDEADAFILCCWGMRKAGDKIIFQEGEEWGVLRDLKSPWRE